ncbi:MAG TPA: large conductance mechanosensitive channel protein MscL, partial [Salinimicrobium sp.]|nr:large conductance mechanosensitive channel protein MscL [Salinimicrobium sp.]
MGLIKEFKEFAIKGNMVDVAIGIIIGAAFNGVVDVLVKKIIMPPLSLLTERVKLSEKKVLLRDGITGPDGTVILEELAIGYGAFIEVLLNFLIIGFTVFLIVKFMNRFRKKAEDPSIKTEVTPSKDIELLNSLNQLMK